MKRPESPFRETRHSRPKEAQAAIETLAPGSARRTATRATGRGLVPKNATGCVSSSVSQGAVPRKPDPQTSVSFLRADATILTAWRVGSLLCSCSGLSLICRPSGHVGHPLWDRAPLGGLPSNRVRSTPGSVVDLSHPADHAHRRRPIRSGDIPLALSMSPLRLKGAVDDLDTLDREARAGAVRQYDSARGSPFAFLVWTKEASEPLHLRGSPFSGRSGNNPLPPLEISPLAAVRSRHVVDRNLPATPSPRLT